MHGKFSFFALMALGLALSACDNGSDARYIEPNEYLPAYPGSYWDYSDGTRVRATNYELHSYRLSTSSSKYSEECYVPIWDGKYLYKYSIYQASPLYPMKELLRAKGSAEWIVDESNGAKLKRSEAFIDSMYIRIPVDSTFKDSLFKEVYQITEYQENMDNTTHWNTREYYAKNVGLIKVEVNNPNDTLSAVVQKEIRAYFINK